MSKQQELKNQIDDISARLSVVENHKVDEKIEKLDSQIRDINSRFSELKGIISVVGLIFTVIGIFGGWNLIKYNKFEASREDVYALLVSQIRWRTATAIDMFKVTEDSDEQRIRIKDLVQLQQRLNNLNITNDQFVSNKPLVEALRLIVQKNDLEAAKNELDTLRNTHTEDTFVISRALTLLAAIEIAKHRETTSETLKGEFVLAAIKRDGTNALAFNILGIICTNQATEKMKTNSAPEEVRKLLVQADMGYKMALDLAPSSSGANKYINNRIWSQLNLVKWHLDHNLPLDDVLTDFNYSDTKTYFQGSRNQLILYTSLAAAASPAMIETEAQSMLVEAQYERLKGNKAEANGLSEKAVTTFLMAIEKGLYKRVETSAEAQLQFKKNFLHTTLINEPKYMEKINDGIKDWFAKNKPGK
jgi:hypothetical protein